VDIRLLTQAVFGRVRGSKFAPLPDGQKQIELRFDVVLRDKASQDRLPEEVTLEMPGVIL
jgi:hypothetical protein